METLTTSRKTIKTVFYVTSAIVIGFLSLKLSYRFSERIKTANEERKVAICPSLLSISRSARDTLIVMKAEPLCNAFVLDNLK